MNQPTCPKCHYSNTWTFGPLIVRLADGLHWFCGACQATWVAR